MDVTVGIKVLICPDEVQKNLFHQNFGCCRKVHNVLLSKYNNMHEKDNTITPTYTFLNKLLNKTKKELSYLYDVDSTSLQQAAKDLATSFSNFFKNPKHFNPPIFHSKRKTRPSFRQTIPINKKIIKDNKLTLRKYGDIKFKTSKEYQELLNKNDLKINNITVTFDGLNYHAIINIETTKEEWELTENYLGCDINSNRNGWLVTSEGIKEHFNVDHENQMIRKINRLMSRCKKGSRKWKKLHKRLLKWYHKRTNRLEDYTNKLVKNLVMDYDTIVFEKNYANIKILIGGEQNLIFPLSRFITKLKNKYLWHKPDAEGVVFVNGYNTSKKCHNCGFINENLEVKTRNWICPKCGTILDRDVNAAINILNLWFTGDSLRNTNK